MQVNCTKVQQAQAAGSQIVSRQLPGTCGRWAVAPETHCHATSLHFSTGLCGNTHANTLLLSS